MTFIQLAIAALAAFACCASLIRIALPHAGRLALAVPNDRSSHASPIPQSGGVFVMLTLVILVLLGAAMRPEWAASMAHLIIPACALAAIGWMDDRFGLPVALRLLAYLAIAVAFVASSARAPSVTGDARLDGALAALFLLGFVNVTNFMDGIDGMIVAEFAPMLLLLGGFAAYGAFNLASGFIALALAGALLGFFLFNRPKASIFLGDSGSLAIGFLGSVLLLDFAQEHGVVAALILPLYFLFDAGVTLARRLWRGERFWSAHRQHFYQRAFDAGQSNWSIIARVALCNLALCAAAVFASMTTLTGVAVAASFAMSAIALLVRSLSRPARPA